MKGKRVPNFNEAYRALNAEGFGIVLIPSDDELFAGFQVVIHQSQFKADARLPQGFFQAIPKPFTSVFGFPPKAKCYNVEKDEATVLAGFRAAGYEVEFQS